MGLSKLRGLSRREKKLVFNTLMLMWGVRLALWLNPNQTIRSVQRRAANKYHAVHFPVYQLLWAIQFASSYVVRPTSLAQGLTAKTLLAKYGYESKLHLGVVEAREKLEAHAWLTQQDQVILGDAEDLASFRPLSSARGQKQTLVWRS